MGSLLYQGIRSVFSVSFVTVFNVVASFGLLILVWYYNPAWITWMMDANLGLIKRVGLIPQYGKSLEPALRFLAAEKAVLVAEVGLAVRVFIIFVRMLIRMLSR